MVCKLKEAGYIDVRKSSRGNYPLTICEITPAGADAYEKYVDAIEEYFQSFRDKRSD
ncbi:MAG: transcriptional regulator [Mangrovibacterium sp.]|nr:transcriptional regulator [Mangrovibacterium sp.]